MTVLLRFTFPQKSSTKKQETFYQKQETFYQKQETFYRKQETFYRKPWNLQQLYEPICWQICAIFPKQDRSRESKCRAITPFFKNRELNQNLTRAFVLERCLGHILTNPWVWKPPRDQTFDFWKNYENLRQWSQFRRKSGNFTSKPKF